MTTIELVRELIRARSLSQSDGNFTTEWYRRDPVGYDNWHKEAARFSHILTSIMLDKELILEIDDISDAAVQFVLQHRSRTVIKNCREHNKERTLDIVVDEGMGSNDERTDISFKRSNGKITMHSVYTRGIREIFEDVARALGGKIVKKSLLNGETLETSEIPKPLSRSTPANEKTIGSKPALQGDGMLVGFSDVYSLLDAEMALKRENIEYDVCYETVVENHRFMMPRFVSTGIYSFNFTGMNVATYVDVNNALMIQKRLDPAFSRRVANGTYKIIQDKRAPIDPSFESETVPANSSPRFR